MASSREEQRQQNIPQGSYPQEETVNPWGIEEVPSSSTAQTTELIRGVRYDHLMEQVVERNNLLQAGIMVNGIRVASEEGTPQGGPLSPLLANIMLDDLDKELMRRGHRFVRYADDCNIYV